MNLNSTVNDNDDDDDQHHHYFGRPLNPSSSSSVSCRIFFGSTQDHMGYYDDHHQVYQPQLRSDNNYDYNYGGSTYEIKNKAHDQSSSGLKLSLWKKEEEEDDDQYDDHDEKISNNIYPVKWMCSKMRVMQKMKKPDDEDRTALSATTAKIEDDQYRNKTTTMHQSSIYNSSSSSMESSDHHLSSNLIRVCADCNTTKTPLWRSGPKGPKSLCNACGIRQRKARRAMAAAANGVAADQLPPAKIKVQRREKKIGRNGGHASNNSQIKKRCKTTPVADSPSSRNDLEDFMINLSKNLSYHRVFPEDEKDAAILLMALSSGLVHV